MNLPTPQPAPTPSAKLATELMVWSSLPLGAGTNQYEFHRVSRAAAECLILQERELAELRKERDEARRDWNALDVEMAKTKADLFRAKEQLTTLQSAAKRDIAYIECLEECCGSATLKEAQALLTACNEYASDKAKIAALVSSLASSASRNSTC